MQDRQKRAPRARVRHPFPPMLRPKRQIWVPRAEEQPNDEQAALTQVHGAPDSTLLLEMEPGGLRTEPTRQTDARPALAQRGSVLSARAGQISDRGKHR
jgi:hypothetical protein